MLYVLVLLVSAVGCNAAGYNVKTVDLPASYKSPLSGWKPANLTQYPFAVQVVKGSEGFQCEGALITPLHVLVPAKCFPQKNIDAKSYMVRIGTPSQYDLAAGGTVTIPSRIITHENYNATSQENNVAVLLLGAPAVLGPTVNVTSLPKQDAEIAPGNSLIAVGWGKPLVSPPTDNGLYEMPFTSANRTSCLSGATYPNTTSMMCAKVVGEHVMGCLTDGGGHLVYDNVLVGMSLGYTCEQYEKPRMYTRIASYTKWIENTVSKLNGAFSERAGLLTLIIPLFYVIISV